MKSSIILIVISGLCFQGCKTATRLGDLGDLLIPAHPNSYKIKEEEIVFIHIHQPPPTSPPCGNAPAVETTAVPSSLAVAAGTFLLDQAQKYIAEELRNEAKKYQQQYSGKYRGGFAEGTHYLAMLRLIPDKPKSKEKPPTTSKNDNNQNVEKKELHIKEKKQDKPLLTIVSDQSIRKKLNENTLNDIIIALNGIIDGDNFEVATNEVATKTKTKPEPEYTLASAVVFEISITKNKNDPKITVGYVDCKGVYFAKAKAKVVGWSGKQPWTWLGGILLKTGDLVTVDVHAKVKGLTDKGAAAVLDENFSGTKFKLGEPTSKSFDRVGDWVLFGNVASGECVPLTFEFRATESDPSNVQQYLKRAGDQVEKSTLLKDLLPNS